MKRVEVILGFEDAVVEELQPLNIKREMLNGDLIVKKLSSNFDVQNVLRETKGCKLDIVKRQVVCSLGKLTVPAIMTFQGEALRFEDSGEFKALLCLRAVSMANEILRNRGIEVEAEKSAMLQNVIILQLKTSLKSLVE